MSRQELRDGAGRVVATYVPYAEVVDLVEVPDGVSLGDTAAALEREFPGRRVAGDVALGRLLASRGARIVRHAHAHLRDLRADPAPAGWHDVQPPTGGRWAPADRPGSELVAAEAAAYPREHVDHLGPRALAGLERILSGAELGPLIPDASGLLVDEEDRVVAALLVCDWSGPGPGAWVAELFRDPPPRWRGAGRALLQRSLAALTAAGAPALSLVVTEGNPARALYDALGFARQFSSVSVVLPA